MEETLVQQLIEFVNEASPVLWAMAQRQVQASIVSHGLWLGIICTITGFFGWLSRYCWNASEEEHTDSDWVGMSVFCIVVTAAGCMVAVVILTGLLNILISPEYAAIRYLLDLIPSS